MAHRLPAWVETGAFLLAFNAGAVNAIALLSFNHQGVSHLSGITTLVGIELATAHAANAAHLALMLLSFVLGAAFSGFVIGGQPLILSRRYSVSLILEAALLAGAMLLLARGSSAGHFVAAAACGLQNAMTSTFSQAIVRTTHVTGVFTDLGVALGLWLRRESPGQRRVLLGLVLVFGFALGGSAGALGYLEWGFASLLVSSGLVALLALAAFVAARPTADHPVSA